MPKAFAPLALSLAGIAVLSGCTSTLVVEPAPYATAAGCADVMLRLPEDIGDYGERKTSAQATEGWGEPAAVVLRCGMEPPAPTTDPCVTVDGVDWIAPVEDTGGDGATANPQPAGAGTDGPAGDAAAGGGDSSWTFVSYGRTPAVEVIIDTTKLSGAAVLSAVSPAVSTLEKTGECVAAGDLTDEGTLATDAPTDAPATSPTQAEDGTD